MQNDDFSNAIRKMYTDFNNSQWKRDIDSYYMWKRAFDAYGSEIAKRRMAEIKAKYPNQQKAFE